MGKHKWAFCPYLKVVAIENSEQACQVNRISD